MAVEAQRKQTIKLSCLAYTKSAHPNPPVRERGPVFWNHLRWAARSSRKRERWYDKKNLRRPRSWDGNRLAGPDYIRKR